ncbi:SURF1 family protein [Sphingobium sp. CR28]|uniref:SURF1 family protein n=1 Tax=Sphingobium sp. CR28 TaxID=3400272 RepID=UPI003FEEE78B
MKRSRTLVRGAIAAALLAMAAGFVALGIWQIERRAWKHALIAAVDARIHRTPAPPPKPAQWPQVSAERDAYRHVRVTGRYRPEGETRVRAVSDLGAGYWVMTPLTTRNFTVLVNRGFVAQGAHALPAPEGVVAVSGLLRISEPDGGFLRRNNPASGNWYSRDVTAIAQAQRLSNVAPYFIDAEARADSDYPVGGLTVVHFPDNHMVYALTWFALAVMSLGGAWKVAATRGRHLHHK